MQFYFILAFAISAAVAYVLLCIRSLRTGVPHPLWWILPVLATAFGGALLCSHAAAEFVAAVETAAPTLKMRTAARGLAFVLNLESLAHLVVTAAAILAVTGGGVCAAWSQRRNITREMSRAPWILVIFALLAASPFPSFGHKLIIVVIPLVLAAPGILVLTACTTEAPNESLGKARVAAAALVLTIPFSIARLVWITNLTRAFETLEHMAPAERLTQFQADYAAAFTPSLGAFALSLVASFGFAALVLWPGRRFARSLAPSFFVTTGIVLITMVGVLLWHEYAMSTYLGVFESML